MKHAGKAQQAAWRLIFLSLGSVLFTLWILFTAFTLYFFRDPEPQSPADRAVIVSPAHGTVDVVDHAEEAEFMGGRCQRISIFLNVFNVHVQRAPVSGKIVFQK